MNFELLSIIIPTFNEGRTLIAILDRVTKINLPFGIKSEIIIVDDGSTDDTDIQISEYCNKNKCDNLKILKHETNQGKGAAIQTGIRAVQGEYFILQDADLEYDPNEYSKLLVPILNNQADIVFGSRFSNNRLQNKNKLHYSANRFLTILSNLVNGLELTDMETCYKLIKTDYIKNLTIKEKRFGFEPEITAKLAKIPNIRIKEVDISYHPRSYKSGKKITWKDGVWAIWCIIKYRLVN